MDKEFDTILKEFISSVSSKTPGFIKAYLFGSFANGVQHLNSDIDVALIIKDLKDSEKFDLQIQLMLLASDFDNRIEPHPFSPEDLVSTNPFIHEILKYGIEIKK
ncbi:MAG: nucleotidyltransferase domain-containing protein [Flavobacteriia bacterium]|nr:nucleotidyltransferase domain-containing protein [Flavobacteriia bacterium]